VHFFVPEDEESLVIFVDIAEVCDLYFLEFPLNLTHSFSFLLAFLTDLPENIDGMEVLSFCLFLFPFAFGQNRI